MRVCRAFAEEYRLATSDRSIAVEDITGGQTNKKGILVVTLTFVWGVS